MLRAGSNEQLQLHLCIYVSPSHVFINTEVKMACNQRLPSNPEFLLQFMKDIDSDLSDDDFDGYIDDNEVDESVRDEEVGVELEGDDFRSGVHDGKSEVSEWRAWTFRAW